MGLVVGESLRHGLQHEKGVTRGGYPYAEITRNLL